MYHPEHFRQQALELSEILNREEMHEDGLSAEHLHARQVAFRFILEVPTPGEDCDVLEWALLVQIVTENIRHFQKGQEDLWNWIKESAGYIAYEINLQKQDTIPVLERLRDMHARLAQQTQEKIDAKRKEKGWQRV